MANTGHKIDIDKLLTGNKRALAKAITLVESTLEKHRIEAQQVLESVLSYSGGSIRIGISGPPGVGKSAFIEAFGSYLINIGKRVAVLAVDPSSPITGGSVLGDKTRMESLSRETNAYIRPSPSSGQLGGVAHKTRESMLLCEAAGFDVILIETVGVGQSEYDVANMVDFFLVLIQPNSGDDLQGIKKGIVELADTMLVNKADGGGEIFARQTKLHYQNAVNLTAYSGFWTPKVLTCSAKENKGIDKIWEVIDTFRTQANEHNEFESKRAAQNKTWMEKLFLELIELKMKATPSYKELRASMEQQVTQGHITPLAAAKTMAALF